MPPAPVSPFPAKSDLARALPGERLHPASLAPHTVESLRAMHGRAHPWTYAVTLGCVIAALVSLPFIEVDLSIHAPGIVRPATERVELRVPLAGRIGQVLAQDNATVATSQPLLVIETPELDERLARNRVLQQEKQSVLGTLETFLAALSMGWEEAARLASGRSPRELPAILVLGQDATHLATQMQANRLAEAKATTEYARARTLHEKGIATRRDLEDAHHSLERTQADGRLLVEDARVRWRTRQATESTALADLISEAARLEASRALAIVRAPIAGTIQGLVGLKPGAVLGTEQVVGTVSPDDRLVIEVSVSSRDIGHVYAGQPVRLQVDAYPYTQWGLVEGRVTALASDAASTGGPSLPTFKVTVEPLRTRLELPNGAEGELGKGMTVSARFLTVRRTLLQIMHQDASEWMSPLNRR